MTTEDPLGPDAPAYQESEARRRWLRLIIALVVINSLVLAGILAWRLLRPERVEIVPAEPRPVTTTTGAGSEPEDQPVAAPSEDADPADEASVADDPVAEPPRVALDEPVTFLVIGSDTRENLPDDLGITDELGGHRADVIMIAAYDGLRVRLLSLPRDLQVGIQGRIRKLNAAYSIDGPNPQLLYETVVNETGIDIDYYIELDFFGFAGIVDGLGGVELHFPYPARDLKSHLDVEAGLQLVDGKTALAYARSRQYQEFRDGRWVSVDADDLGRIGRQQSLIFAMLAAAKRLSAFDMFSVSRVLRAVGQHLRVDARLSDRQLVEFVIEARKLDREDIEIVTLPVFERREDDVSYLIANGDAAEAVYGSFRGDLGDSPDGAPPSEPARLLILNGNGGGGEADRWRVELEDGGFVVVEVDDAGSFEFEDTVVTVRAGDLDTGVLIVDALGFGEVRAGTLDEGLDAVVVIGADALGR